MEALVELESPKAGRILAVARELVLKRGVKGVSVAEIAEKAHVGKGTIYLYWTTKEDLYLGLCARDYLSTIDEFVTMFTEDPAVGQPRRFCPALVRGGMRHPFVHAIQSADVEVLGVLADHPKAHELLERFGSGAMLHAVLPVWREHGMARTDWDLAAQAHALRAVIAGFISVENQEPVHPATDDVLAATVEALLGPSAATPQDVEAVAAEALRMLAEARTAVLAMIATPQP